MRSIYKACIAAFVVIFLGVGAAQWASADDYGPPGDAQTSSSEADPAYPTYPPPVTPTPTPTVPVVPIPALFDAEPTPPTCETAGSFDFGGTFPNVSVTVSPSYDGPGVYTLTITAENGATFPDGTTTKTRVITVADALGFQSTDPDAPCYRAPTPTPTPTPTVPVVPIPALFDAEPTPPTCETAGSFDFEDTFPNVSVVVSPAYDGPGTYTLTITAENGATFPDGTTSKTRTITVEDALGFQSTNPAAPCYQAPPPPPPPTPTPTELRVGVLQPVCDNDVPRLRYEITATGTTSTTVTITWLNPEGPNVVYVDQPLSGAVLWPGAVPGPNGRGIDWPGWRQLSNGTWVQGDEFDWVRPTVQVLFQVNPEATVTVSYPPSSPDCLVNPVNQVLDDDDALSATGTDAWTLLSVSAALALVGSAVLGGVVWLRRRESGVE